MKRKLLLGMALLGFLQFSFAFDLNNVTETYLQNYHAPFLTTGEALIPNAITSGERFQKLAAPWVTEGDVGTMGVDYTSWHVDFQKSPNFPAVQADSAGVMTLTVGWDGFATSTTNMKVYQTITLPAGKYELDARTAQDWSGAAEAYLVVAAGTGLPNTTAVSTALGSAQLSSAVNNVVAVKFTLTAETTVSLGCVANLTNKHCVTIANFVLYQTLGTDYRALKALVGSAKAYTPVQYPIGTISGTYPQAKWDGLQSAILQADAFIALGEYDTQENVDAQVVLLQAAINDLNGSMVLPFKISDTTNEYWYQIRDRRATNSYWQIGEYVGETSTVTMGLIMSQTGDITLDDQLFKFVKAPAPSKGYYIYNKLIADTPLSASLDANFIQISADSVPATWQFGKTKADAAHFTVFVEGDVTNQLNSYASYSPQYIGFYYPGINGSDAGNDWEFVELLAAGQTDFSSLKPLVANSIVKNQVDYPAANYSVDMWNAFVVARTAAVDLVSRESNTPQPTQVEVDAMVLSLQTAIDNLNNSYVPFVVSTGETENYYLIRDKRATPSYLFIGDDVTNALAARLLYRKVTPTADSTAYMFKVVPVSGQTDVYQLYCKAYPGVPVSVSVDNIIHVDGTAIGEESNWIFGATPANDVKYRTIALQSTAAQLNSFQNLSNGYIDFWSPTADDAGNDWMFIKAPVSTGVKQVTVSDLGISVVNRRILSKDANAKLNVYSVLGQKVNAKAELGRGIYLVKVEGKQGTVKLIVR